MTGLKAAGKKRRLLNRDGRIKKDCWQNFLKASRNQEPRHYRRERSARKIMFWRTAQSPEE